MFLLLMACSSTPDTSTVEAQSSGTTTESESEWDGRWFDAHLHLLPTDRDAHVLELSADAGIHDVFLFGPGNAEAHGTDRVHAFATIHRNADDEQLLDDAAAEIESQLDNGAVGVGELSVFHNPTPQTPDAGDRHAPDDPRFLAVYAVAAERGAPINVHIEYDGTLDDGRSTLDAFSEALLAFPDATFIWAHMGDADADTVGRMLDDHANLRVDISCRNDVFQRGRPHELQALTDDAGILEEEWATLFALLPSRFLFGTDVFPPERTEQYSEVLAYYADIFDTLDPDVARAISHDNAASLF